MNLSDKPGYTFRPVGCVRSPLKEKFGLPRQPGLVPELKARIEIHPPYDRDEAFRGLEEYSHIWLLSVFHLAQREQWQATVRPPRLGGNVRVGVFASRAPYRPNPIALSLCALNGISRDGESLQLSVTGCDLVDGTPVLDIKPYLPYADRVESARAGFSEMNSPMPLSVQWSSQAQQQANVWLVRFPDLIVLAQALIRQDPRPAYQHQAKAQEYGMQLYDFNVRFVVRDREATIVSIDPI